MNEKIEKNISFNANSYPIRWPGPKSELLQIPNCSDLEGLPMTDKRFKQLRAWWWIQFEDIMVPALEELPLMRGVNHRINLIDMSLRHPEQHATCPQALKDQLREKMSQYECARWWVCQPVPTTCPLLCIAKKDGSLWTVIDAHNHNANTILDVTPLPDMRYLMDSMAQKRYQSKINMTDAYEQIHIETDCVQYSRFATPYGTFESNVMQQGDCNAPSTFQWVLTWVFHDRISMGIHAWFDDIFTGTSTVKEHNEWLLWVYTHLRDKKLYISKKKFNPFAPILDILGCKVDAHGVHT